MSRRALDVPPSTCGSCCPAIAYKEAIIKGDQARLSTAMSSVASGTSSGATVSVISIFIGPTGLGEAPENRAGAANRSGPWGEGSGASGHGLLWDHSMQARRKGLRGRCAATIANYSQASKRGSRAADPGERSRGSTLATAAAGGWRRRPSPASAWGTSTVCSLPGAPVSATVPALLNSPLRGASVRSHEMGTAGCYNNSCLAHRMLHANTPARHARRRQLPVMLQGRRMR